MIIGLGIGGIVVGAIVTILGKSVDESDVEGLEGGITLVSLLVVSIGTVGIVGLEVVAVAIISLEMVVGSVGLSGSGTIMGSVGFSDSNIANIEGNGVGSVSSNGILRRKVSQIGSGFMCRA